MRKFIITSATTFALVIFGGSAIAEPDVDLVNSNTHELADAQIVPGTELIAAPVQEDEPVEEEVEDVPEVSHEPAGDPSDHCQEIYDSVADYFDAYAEAPECFQTSNEKEVVQTQEENDRLVAEMCREWNSPGHGSWALDPGDVDEEYTNSMNETCNSQVEDPTQIPETTPVPEPTPAVQESPSPASESVVGTDEEPAEE